MPSPILAGKARATTPEEWRPISNCEHTVITKHRSYRSAGTNGWGASQENKCGLFRIQRIGGEKSATGFLRRFIRGRVQMGNDILKGHTDRATEGDHKPETRLAEQRSPSVNDTENGVLSVQPFATTTIHAPSFCWPTNWPASPTWMRHASSASSTRRAWCVQSGKNGAGKARGTPQIRTVGWKDTTGKAMGIPFYMLAEG